MKIFGFTIIKTKKLDKLKQEVKDLEAKTSSLEAQIETVVLYPDGEVAMSLRSVLQYRRDMRKAMWLGSANTDGYIEANGMMGLINDSEIKE